jgi:hypothetical protein
MKNTKMLPASLGILMLLLLASVLAIPAFSFLAELTTPTGGGTPQNDHWSFSAFAVQWNLNPSVTGAHVSGSQTVAEVVQASFTTWINAPNTALTISRGADSSLTQESTSPSNVNLICFVCTDAGFGGSGTLAITSTTTADAAGQDDGHGGTAQFAGQIIKADISFNPAVTFSTGGASGQDLQTVATHEIGHFLGLDHSGVVRAMMYPFAPDVLTTLGFDDVAGISTLYPNSTADVSTGSIAGKITLNGGNVFGAHVYAASTTSANPFSSFANIRKTPIGALSLPDGTYTIAGVPADSYEIVAEPLDLPVSNTDVSGFPQAFNQGAVQTNFTTRWH